ncbi:cellulose biosynthesis protein BcsC [Caldimonas tepidiphila]|uniref:cellulose biosynthesis protein BcsC n=1 Tax=Caldimonas tepidiphila TaxID=2315841 RepID=UPI000E5B75A4|nr:cellulose biosynthesis protein BcsC [Caldimonas tepidiphila]
MSKNRALALGIAIALGAGAATAQDAAIRPLIEQAQYWQQRGRGDRAAEAWQKLLRVVPDHPDALLGLAQVELQAGNAAGANERLARLKAAHPQDPRIARLEAQIRTGSPGAQAQLAQARDLARAGKAEEAALRYKEAIGARPPADPGLALEYYQTLGGTAQGWEEARAGLERLARERPDDVRAALALAEHLSYREATRPAGIEALARLAGRPEVAAQAQRSWRRALEWLGTRAADAPLYQAYLRAHPGDAGIAARLEQIARRQQDEQRRAAGERAAGEAAAARGQAIDAAFALLDQGALEQAEQRFGELLSSRPGDSSALGGLGILRLKQSRYAEARQLLESASKSGAQRWSKALASARYWSAFELAEQARAAGDSRRALELLQQAVRLDAAEPAAQRALADVLAELDRAPEAEAQYRKVLALHPGDAPALQGLIGLLARQERAGEALALAASVPPPQRAQLAPLGRLRAEQLRRDATAAEQRGDAATARAALEEALQADPDHVWVRLDLTRNYLRAKALPEARSLVEGLLLTQPSQPEALFASALLSAETGDWAQAVQMLERVRPEQRTREMSALYTRAWVQQQLARVRSLAQGGQAAAARSLLARVEPHAQGDADLQTALATAHADLGDAPRALGMMRRLMSQSATPETGLQLRYAGLLLAARQHVELAGLMRRLQGMPLDEAQRGQYERLRSAYLVQQADLLREAGNLEGAYEMIAPLLAGQPPDPAALGALARLHSGAGEHAEALALYDALLRQSPEDHELLLAAAGAALGARQLERAQNLILTGLESRPQDPQLLAGAARLFRARGQAREAEQYLRAAVAAEEAQRLATAGAAAATAAGPAPVRGSNPFQGRTGTSRTSLPAAAMLPAGAPGTGSPADYRGVPPAAPAAAAPLPARSGASAERPMSPQRASAASQARPDVPAAGPARTAPGGLPDPAPVASAVAPAWAAHPASPAGAPLAAAAPHRTALRDELAQLAQERATSVSIGSELRQRAGEPGLGAVSELKLPIAASTSAGNGRVTLEAVPTVIEAGTPSAQYDTASRFGGGPEASLGGSGRAGSQSASGVGLGLVYDRAGFQARIGTTPLGFPHAELVAGLRWQGPAGGGLAYTLNLSRRPLDDSLLAIAGMTDRRYGLSWGGVMASGVRLDLAREDGPYQLYGWGLFDALDGRQVASNRRIEGGAGMNYRLLGSETETLLAGINLTLLGYQRNLRHYTYGHGGYFSPQSFASLSVPLEWKLRSGATSYQIAGAIGLQGFHEDAADYFPTDPQRQARAVNAAGTAGRLGLTTQPAAVHEGQTKVGLAYRVSGRAEYQLTQQLHLGGVLGFDSARNYRQLNAGVYMRYSGALSGDSAAPPATLPSLTTRP